MLFGNEMSVRPSLPATFRVDPNTTTVKVDPNPLILVQVAGLVPAVVLVPVPTDIVRLDIINTTVIPAVIVAVVVALVVAVVVAVVVDLVVAPLVDIITIVIITILVHIVTAITEAAACS
jgi:hypothetical protein